MTTVVVAGLLTLLLATTGSSSQPKPEGYLAEPKSGRGRGVLVLHAWWGLNGDVKAYCDRLAEAGFVAFAPDLFDGKVATTEEGALALVKEYQPKDQESRNRIQEAAAFLGVRSGNKELAVVGFSFGAYYALLASNEFPEVVKAVVVYYGTGEEDFSKSKASYLGHFASDDDFEPKEVVDGLAKILGEAGLAATIHTYPDAGHWFCEPSVTKAYNKGASELAWDRTLEFLKRLLSARQALCYDLPHGRP